MSDRRSDGKTQKRATLDHEIRRVAAHTSESVKRSTKRLTQQYAKTLKELSKR